MVNGSTHQSLTITGAFCSDVMKILSDATRLSVVELLLDRPLRVHELNAVLKLEPTLLSHHLRILRDAGLVIARREGKAVLYRLSPEIRKNGRSSSLNFGCCKLQFKRHG
ncbi:MAG: ArsR/SmtB family transcription factor [Thermomicrobiales bacterium]